MYRLDLIGFQNQRLVPCATVEQARAEYIKAKGETFKATSLGHTSMVGWTMWELWKLGEEPTVIASGEF